MPGTNPYAGDRRARLERELQTLRSVEQAHAGYLAALAVARDAADTRSTRDRIDEVMDALGDIRADQISHPIRQVEDALYEIDRRADRAAALSARPRVL